MNKWNQKRKIMQRYDLTAQMYDARYAEEQAAKYQAALRHLNIEPDNTVLDVGCGTGLLFSNIGIKAKDIVGIDLSRLSLQQAKKRTRLFQNSHLIQADSDYLPFTNGCFDVIFAFTVLQNMPKPSETLNEIKRNVKPSGLIVATGLRKTFTLKNFSALLNDAGLRIISLEHDCALKGYIAITSLNQ